MKVIAAILLLISSSIANDCEEKWNGDCELKTKGCKKEQMSIVSRCDSADEVCCVDLDKTPCHGQFEATCKEKCDNTDIQIGREWGYLGFCLCPDDDQGACCLKKDNDLCKDQVDGKCMEKDQCKSKNGIPTAEQLCTDDAHVCCVESDQECEKLHPGGICVERERCPTGFKSREELCIEPKPWKSPANVEWCEKSDHICCIKST